jgi:hypothetical protein
MINVSQLSCHDHSGWFHVAIEQVLRSQLRRFTGGFPLCDSQGFDAGKAESNLYLSGGKISLVQKYRLPCGKTVELLLQSYKLFLPKAKIIVDQCFLYLLLRSSEIAYGAGGAASNTKIPPLSRPFDLPGGLDPRLSQRDVTC